jgi:hypothetical protein
LGYRYQCKPAFHFGSLSGDSVAETGHPTGASYVPL